MTQGPHPYIDLAVPRRTHPASPLVAGVRIGALAFIGVFLVIGDLADRVPVPRIALAGLGALGLACLVGVGAWLSWRRLTYWIDDDGDLRVDSGIWLRQDRRLQLSRLQSVDVVAPLLARLLGLVELRVEVAGSGDSRVVLRFLDRATGERVRSTILVRAGEAVPVDEGPDGAAGGLEFPGGLGARHPETLLAAVPEGRLLGALLLRTTTVVLVVATVLFVFITVVTQGPAALAVAVVTGGVPLFAVVGEFLTFARFTAARTSQGVRLRHGLLQTQTRTIPRGRVQAVELVAPLLWRPLGWVRVTLTVAGIGGDGAEEGRAVLLPVAPRSEALSVVEEVLPGVAIDDLPWQSAPARSRWRSPMQWRILAYAVTPRVFAGRSGRITRRISLAPHARTQSVSLMQGAWQRHLSLATVRVDVAPGPVTVRARHMNATDARRLADEQCDRSRQAEVAE